MHGSGGWSGVVGIGIDSSGNVYTSDAGHNAIFKWQQDN
jgi:hypothetical protein